MSDDKTPTSKTSENQTPQFVRPPGFQYVFANQARIRVAPGELSFGFMYADETPVGPTLTEMVSVTMSPTHARRFSAMLTEMLRGYEKAFGAIPPEAPPGATVDASEVQRRVELIIKGQNPD